MNEEEEAVARSFRKRLAGCRALLVGAGAGMGVDSGLPDFRGTAGFWEAYPPLAKLGIRFEEMANPRWFRENPSLAWGFYGHRLKLYREVTPHEGFSILGKWIKQLGLSSFVFTSNVDGHFQRSGFPSDALYECHGSLMRLQCIERCGQEVWPVKADLQVEIDDETLHARDPLPSCLRCGGPARPNILMFSDWEWDSSRTGEQAARLEEWLDENVNSGLCVIELGAGSAIPTVRLACEGAWQSSGGTFLRINPREPEVPEGGLSLAMGALSALRAVDAAEAGG